jgi:hypothetical protein
MNDASLTWIIAGAALVASAGQMVFNSGWGLSGKLSKMERSQTKELTAMESRLAQTVAETARDLEERHERTAEAFGESIRAVREQLVLNEKDSLGSMHDLSDQIRKVEIWTRDEFVRKESFRDICTRIESIVAEQGRTLNSAVQGLHETIVGIVARNDKVDHRDHRA